MYLKVNYLGSEKDTLKYKFSEMNFVFEISRVDCISKENYYFHFNIKKIHLNHLKHPPFPPHFSARNTLSARSTLMHLVYKNKNILFPSFQLIVHSLTHVDHLTGGLL